MKTKRSRKKNSSRMSPLLHSMIVASLACISTSALGALTSLTTFTPPVALDQGTYVPNPLAAIILGKALFWDMQVGSDGVQACGTCHFHAGADSRTVNQINPGILGGDSEFGNNNLGLPQPAAGAVTVNQTLTPAHFPTHKLINQHFTGDPAIDPGNVVSDNNDVISSQGVKLTQFLDIVPGNPVDLGTPIADPIFTNGVENVRRVEPRNTPTVFNAAYSFYNFWDGRANNIFNGDNPFGPADPRPHLLTNATGSLATEELRLRHSSLASQAVGPPLSDFEMSYQGRTFPKVGKKMLSLTPLAQQKVDTTDSVLGPYAQPTAGLTVSYRQLIELSFPAKYWNNTSQKVTYDANGIPSFAPWDGITPLTTDEYTQMEANFSFFFGMAVQMYEQTLVTDDSKLDQWFDLGAPPTGFMTPEELRGFGHYNAFCLACHDGAVMTDNDVLTIQGIQPLPIGLDLPQPLNLNPLAANDFMLVGSGSAFYDSGSHNSGVRPGGNPDPTTMFYLATNEDVGRGGLTGMGAGLTEVPLGFGFLSIQAETVELDPLFQFPGLDPTPARTFMTAWVPPLPLNQLPSDTFPQNRSANFGVFKTPSIRNAELTGPYMHHGGFSTLRQVVDFYVRGGDFPQTNVQNFDDGILPIPLLRDDEVLVNELMAFLLTMTDNRVRRESAPFDHPEIFVPITGTAPVSPGSRDLLVANSTDFQQIPAIGENGRDGIFTPLLGTFLGLLPTDVALVADADLDLIEDGADNCPNTVNLGQEDSDGDGVGDACDNCIDVANGPLIPDAGGNSQRDTDGDGYGNMCDADINGDNTVNALDYGQFRNVWLNTAPGVVPYTTADHMDFNGDGVVNAIDYGIFRNSWLSVPGPSALNP